MERPAASSLDPVLEYKIHHFPILLMRLNIPFTNFEWYYVDVTHHFGAWFLSPSVVSLVVKSTVNSGVKSGKIDKFRSTDYHNNIQKKISTQID